MKVVIIEGFRIWMGMFRPNIFCTQGDIFFKQQKHKKGSNNFHSTDKVKE
jgi:hypothetical protein